MLIQVWGRINTKNIGWYGHTPARINSIFGNRRIKALKKIPFVAKHENLAGDVEVRLGFVILTPYISTYKPLYR